MSKINFKRRFSLDINSPISVLALIALVITQVPVAIKTLAELACIGEVSNQAWRDTNSHAGVNIKAVQTCNGKN